MGEIHPLIANQRPRQTREKNETIIHPVPRNVILVGSVFCFFFWSLSQWHAPTTIQTVDLGMYVELKPDEIQACLSAYDGQNLWSLNSTHFQEPPCLDFLDSYGEMEESSDIKSASITDLPDDHVQSMVSNCDHLRNKVLFPSQPHSRLEGQYSLAYVIIAHGNNAQMLRFLRNIYWPQNLYCFALSPRASKSYQKFVYSLAQCFDNVFLKGEPGRSLPNYQYRYGLLQTVMDCYDTLLQNRTWNYVLTVSTFDFPLKTNLELVNILPLLNGSNDCSLQYARHDEYGHKQGGSSVSDSPDGQEKNDKIPAVNPDGLILFRGDTGSTLTYDFVQYLLRNETSQRLLRWLNGTSYPELYFISTLVHNTFQNPPGGFPGMCLWWYSAQEEEKSKLSYTRIWDAEDVVDRRQCKRVDGFYDNEFLTTNCKAGLADLAWYIEQPHFMAQRFDIGHEPTALYCLEKWHWEKVCQRKTAVTAFNYSQVQATRYSSANNKDEFLC